MVGVQLNLHYGDTNLQQHQKRKSEDKFENRAKKFGKIFELLRFSKIVTKVT